MIRQWPHREVQREGGSNNLVASPVESKRKVDDVVKDQGDNQGAILGVTAVVKEAFPKDMKMLSSITPMNINDCEKEVAKETDVGVVKELMKVDERNRLLRMVI